LLSEARIRKKPPSILIIHKHRYYITRRKQTAQKRRNQMKTALILITAILMTSNAFATTKNLNVRASVSGPALEVTNKPVDPINNYVISTPDLKSIPAGLTIEQTKKYLNDKMIIPEEVKKSGMTVSFIIVPVSEGATK
jgi:hypothetical protein